VRHQRRRQPCRKAVPKRVFLDLVATLNAHGISSNDIPAKLESLAFGQDIVVYGAPKHTLAVANDNDFVATVAGPCIPPASTIRTSSSCSRSTRPICPRCCRRRCTPSRAAMGVRATMTADNILRSSGCGTKLAGKQDKAALQAGFFMSLSPNGFPFARRGSACVDSHQFAT
jgi:hypothetical protein